MIGGNIEGLTLSDETTSSEPETLLELDEDILEFWGDRDEWPRDRAPYIFLARVVDLLGKARFEDNWLGLNEPILQEAKRQRGVIFEELAEQLATGALATFTRAVDGGKFEAVSPDVWNTDTFRKRFVFCRIDMDDPFPGCSDEEAGWYLYLDRDEVDALIRSQPNAHLRIDNADSLPAFLAVLVKTAASLQLTAGSAALSAEAIGAVFFDQALKAGIDRQYLSKSVMRYAATFLRPPGAPRTAHKN